MWPHRVELEPPFRPFLPHGYVPARGITDDARRSTFLSRLAGALIRKAGGGGSPEGAAIEAPEPDDEPWPASDTGDSTPTELLVSLPPDLKVTPEAAVQLLMSLPPHLGPLGFEVVGDGASVTVQWVAAREDVSALEQQIRARFPDMALEEEPESLAQRWEAVEPGETLVVDFGLSNEFMLPLSTPRNFETDPLIGVVGALAGLDPGEVAVLQVLFRPARHVWGDSVRAAVADPYGGAFFLDAPDFAALARTKVSEPLFAVILRVGARSPSSERTWEIVRALGGALGPLANPGSNELMPLSNSDLLDEEHEADLLARRTHRSGMLLNVGELAALVHLPSPAVRSEKLLRERRMTKEAPASATGQGLILGENRHRGKTIVVSLPPAIRLRHMHLIGATGTGKSHLLLNLIGQDIESGKGLGVLDPHGDLIDAILGRIPEQRHADVVLLDPADEEYSVPFNILSAHSELEKNLMASDLVAIFRRLATSWGDQMTSVLRNAVLAFLESEEGGTLSELRRFLVEPEFRKSFLQTVRDQEVVYFWEREFPLLSGRPQGPLLTRLDSFLAPKPLRRMVSQRESRLDFAEIMGEGRIFLARLAQGAIGEENAHLLGSLLASKFQQLAAARQALPESERRPFFLYVDEFQNFATPSMAQILSGARKYGLGLTLAHQDLAQLEQSSSGLASAVLTNPATRICFRVGDRDAKKLADGFRSFDASDIQSLGVGEAVCRIERSDWDFNLRTFLLPEVDQVTAQARTQEIVQQSRAAYGTPVADLPETLPKARAATEGPTRAPASPSEPREKPEPAGTTSQEREQAAPRGKAASPPEPPQPAPLGKGGAEHIYLQDIIKRWAGRRGWRVTVEKPVLDGLGRVDVALEREGMSVACEVTVTTPPKHELQNVQKCLAAGFEAVVVVSTERKVLRTAEKLVTDTLGDERLERVRFCTPEELFAFLEEQEARSAASEETIGGRKVKTRYARVDEAERDTRTQAIAKVILDAAKRLRGKSQ